MKFDENDFCIGCKYFNGRWWYRINSNKYAINDIDTAAKFFNMTPGTLHDIMVKEGFFYNNEDNYMYHDNFKGCYDFINGWIKEFFDSRELVNVLNGEEIMELKTGIKINERFGLSIIRNDIGIAKLKL